VIPTLRRSQLIWTYGPGAIVDLPRHTTIVMGLDHWTADGRQRIIEDRLTGWLARRLQRRPPDLFTPPVEATAPGAPRTGIAVMQFPAWFIAQGAEEVMIGDRVYRTRRLVHFKMLDRGQWRGPDGKRVAVVPVRFARACRLGHIDDVDWYAYLRPLGVNNGDELWLDEGDAGNDLSQVYVRCARNDARRSLAEAQLDPDVLAKMMPLGQCRGRRPWLGPDDHEECAEACRLLNTSASNAYFAQTVSVISIPDGDKSLRDLIAAWWEDLGEADSLESVQYEIKKTKMASAFRQYTPEVVWGELLRIRGEDAGSAAPAKPIKQVEMETLLKQPDGGFADEPDGDFFARRLLGGDGVPRDERIGDVILLHRLREVSALFGFTRFEPPITDVDGELAIDVVRAPLAHEESWFPAVENRGEGFLVTFRPEAIAAWAASPGVKARERQLQLGFERWRERQGSDKAEYPGIVYTMLHTLSHLLITAVSLECGYSASSIKERIYRTPAGCGILLYTGTSGSEGTLGGLVEIGRNIRRHLDAALVYGRLCSNDPVCAQHEPHDHLEERYLNGAACHGCLLIGETSCERRNELLDRALVVPTVATPDAAFFGDHA
jgi:hypothetical protein